MIARGERVSSRALAAVAVSLYVLAMLVAAAHPLFHEESNEALTYGLCNSDCHEHHAGAERCAHCATLTKKYTSHHETPLRLIGIATSSVMAFRQTYHESTDTRLPGLRGPPAAA